MKHPRTNPLLLDSDGFSALYWAAKRSTPEIISVLLNKGCDPNQASPGGMTPLFAAVATNKVENVKALISHPTNKSKSIQSIWWFCFASYSIHS